MVTGDGGMTWVDHSIGETTIVRTQAFHDAVYAYSINGRVYRYQPSSDGALNMGTGAWWTATTEGFLLRLLQDEVVESVDVFDLMGRQVPATVNGPRVVVHAIAGELYLLRMKTNMREESGKAAWRLLD
jgi:hypothetical protein